MKFNGFITALLFSILVAWFLPQGPEILPLRTITDIGIGFIFFFYGLKLSPAEFKAGFYNYRVHILIQLTTFVIFPLLALAFLPFFEAGTASDLWLALFFLGALPSTVSSSIVMVSLARGNLPTAIFNASLSGLIGIVATPLWMSMFMAATSDFEFGAVVQKLMLQIIFPLVLGLFFQKWLGNLARKNSKKISFFDKSVIILIVYSSFSAAFSTQLYTSVGIEDLLKLLLMVSLLFFVVYFGLGSISKVIGLNTEDEIAAKFCGTKKSLVHGSVMVKVIFGNSAANALYLLPIMLYHILQLLVIAIFAERYRRRPVE
ncbi:bile acid:sodium symporter family protein [Salinimicrobium oceani]|uniref:Bile acid:sodium symporter n=1 Tax=Salinimicrobium oceani TaxID=2722702 RepID=A0ABX1D2I6_9FLAO|nr:bile acid:sodium symporter family protein [Salinimicrobium oceani]NJW52766.1 bile acid:sodium symporter [Salinimicrobium oceani]